MPEQQESDRSLDELDPWGPVPEDATPMIERVHAARQKPVGTLTADELRLLIGQKISLDVLLPRAVRILEADPLLEATYYPGDLLENVLEVPADTWIDHPDLATTVRAILDGLPEVQEELADDVERFRHDMGWA